jgi:predicted O-methyltransferase YrrM
MLNLNRRRLSRAIWDTLFADLPDLPWHVIEDLEKLDPARRTGSTNHASLIALWAVIRYFRPKTVAEVGTYIGKSTFVLSRLGADVHTCDMILNSQSQPRSPSTTQAAPRCLPN